MTDDLTSRADAVYERLFGAPPDRDNLPLPTQATVEMSGRYRAGSAIQQHLYGDEIRAEFADGTSLGDAVPRLLTEFCFGDFETRDGLDVATRELLILCALAALGHGPQVEAHIQGCSRAGIAPDTIAAALMHCIPYVGFPNALNAIRAHRRHLAGHEST